MQFKCVNCGGNVIYDPVKHAMVCESCNAVDSEELVKQERAYTCPSCGGQYTVNEYTSATKCDYCGSYNIVDEKIQYPYGPDLLIPFRFSKEQATELLRKEFKDRLFCPSDFLSTRTLENFKGEYVPFWLYSYNTHAVWDGIGTKVRTWVSGDTEYTETSKFQVYREMNIDFKQVPVDASIPMPDKVMDLMEPYEYGDMVKFEPKYMSGYSAETYNLDPIILEPRAKEKIEKDTDTWIRDSISGYTTVTATRKNNVHTPSAREFAMLPIWKYTYRYRNKDFDYYINGQTGKVYGSMPKSIGKIWFTGLSFFAALSLLVLALIQFVEVF